MNLICLNYSGIRRVCVCILPISIVQVLKTVELLSWLHIFGMHLNILLNLTAALSTAVCHLLYATAILLEEKVNWQTYIDLRCECLFLYVA